MIEREFEYEYDEFEYEDEILDFGASFDNQQVENLVH